MYNNVGLFSSCAEACSSSWQVLCAIKFTTILYMAIHLVSHFIIKYTCLSLENILLGFLHTFTILHFIPLLVQVKASTHAQYSRCNTIMLPHVYCKNRNGLLR